MGKNLKIVGKINASIMIHDGDYDYYLNVTFIYDDGLGWLG